MTAALAADVEFEIDFNTNKSIQNDNRSRMQSKKCLRQNDDDLRIWRMGTCWCGDNDVSRKSVAWFSWWSRDWSASSEFDSDCQWPECCVDCISLRRCLKTFTTRVLKNRTRLLKILPQFCGFTNFLHGYSQIWNSGRN